MKSKSSLTREQKIAICKSLYEDGLSSRDIEKKTSIAKSSVAIYLKEANVASRKNEILSEKATNRISPLKGKKRSIEFCKKISAAQKGNTNCLGRIASEETRKRISDAVRSAFALRPKKEKPEFVGPRKPRGRWVPDDQKIARKKARQAMKNMIRRILSMSRKRKDKKSEHILGYSKQDLINHIESQFRHGMSWEKRDSFHIDHIIPVAHFFRNGIFDPAVINALSNLQVLTPEENMRKNDKLISND